MMSSCLGGGGSTPSGFHLHILNSPTRSSSSSSPASSFLTSTLSDSTNSPLLSVSTRKPRTPRKRPNQTYYEAAALLSTAFPNVFSSAPLTHPLICHRPPHHTSSPDDSSQLFLPFRILEDDSAFLIHHPSEDQKFLSFLKETRPSPYCDRPCQTPDHNEIQSKAASHLRDDEDEDDFDAESMLDEELEEGIIDRIMGEKSGSGCGAEKSDPSKALKLGPSRCRRIPMGLLGLGGSLGLCYHGIRKAGGGSDVGQVNWWNFLTVNVNDISPKLNPNPASSRNNLAAEKKKKKKKKVDKAQPAVDVSTNRNTKGTELGSPATMRLGSTKMLKLDYNNVLEAWTERGSPFLVDIPASDVAGRVDQVMELIMEGMREESLQRHREKRSRPFTTTKKKMK